MNLLEIFSMFCFTIKNLVPTSIIVIKDAIINFKDNILVNIGRIISSLTILIPTIMSIVAIIIFYLNNKFSLEFRSIICYMYANVPVSIIYGVVCALSIILIFINYFRNTKNKKVLKVLLGFSIAISIGSFVILLLLTMSHFEGKKYISEWLINVLTFNKGINSNFGEVSQIYVGIFFISFVIALIIAYKGHKEELILTIGSVIHVGILALFLYLATNLVCDIIFCIIILNALYRLKYKIDFEKSKRKYKNIKREYENIQKELINKDK